jgi:hypothetical protein
MIAEADDRLQIFDFLLLRADANVKFEEEFDEDYEFLNQMESKLNSLTKEVETARKEGIR